MLVIVCCVLWPTYILVRGESNIPKFHCEYTTEGLYFVYNIIPIHFRNTFLILIGAKRNRWIKGSMFENNIMFKTQFEITYLLKTKLSKYYI